MQNQTTRKRDVECLTRAMNRALRNKDFGQRREFAAHVEKARAILLRYLKTVRSQKK